MDAIPDETLAGILQRTDSHTLLIVVPRVCRRWRRVVRLLAQVSLGFRWCRGGADPEWGDYSSEAAPLTDTRLSALVTTQFLAMRGLDLTGCTHVTDAGLATLAAACPRLRTLRLPATPGITVVGMEYVAQGCRQLKALTLPPGNTAALPDIDAWLEVIGQGLKQLRRLSLVRSSVTDAGLAHLVTGCRSLTALDLTHCDELSEAGFLATVGTMCPHLVELVLDGCPWLSSASFATLAIGCPRLTRLGLQFNPQVTEEFLVVVGTALSGLRRLSLGDCPRVTAAGVAGVAVRCPYLTSLDLRRVLSRTGVDYRDALQAIGSSCSRLTQLNLHHCAQISNKDLIAIGKGCSLLQRLNLYRCLAVGDEGLGGIADGCHYLWELNLMGCTRVTDTGLAMLGDGCPVIASLSLGGCVWITTRGIGRLVSQCVRMAALDLSDCTQITDAALAAIGRNCPDLHSLRVANCHQLTIFGIAAVEASCPWLDKVCATGLSLKPDLRIPRGVFPSGDAFPAASMEMLQLAIRH